ncbi:MAG: methyltransferase domain-containing protein [Actinobacteria bacterium]|nr:methyltransferase domain-containing protein [Actinomycetota bacterium]
MRILGRNYHVFGRGVGRVNFILPYVSNADVLDIGVVQHDVHNIEERNWIHRHVADVANSCLGVDIDDVGVEKLKDLGFNVIRGDAQNLDISERFDVVVAGDVIEHLDNPGGLIQSAQRHLRPRGLLLITTPNPWWWMHIIRAIKGRVHVNPEHTTWFSLGTLTELLRRYGFVIDHYEYGSGDEWLYRLIFLPRMIRHRSLWVVARSEDERISNG